MRAYRMYNARLHFLVGWAGAYGIGSDQEQSKNTEFEGSWCLGDLVCAIPALKSAHASKSRVMIRATFKVSR